MRTKIKVSRWAILVLCLICVLSWTASGYCTPAEQMSTLEAKGTEPSADAARPAGITSGPGTLLATVPVAIPSPIGVGIGVAVDCKNPATMYYTNSFSPLLHSMTTSGIHLASVLLFDAATSDPITFGAITWDESRGMIWGGTDNGGSPIKVYLIDPVTGACTYKFTATTVGVGFSCGIAMDRDQTLWVGDDIADIVEHWDVSGAPVLIGTITPKDPTGGVLGLLSGIAVGKGDRLYLGRNGMKEIVAVTKTGNYITHFATTSGRVQGLACDMVTFAPLEVIWAKDSYDDIVEAFEVESGTCDCAGAGDIPTLTEWGMIIMFVVMATGIVWFIVRQRRRLATA